METFMHGNFLLKIETAIIWGMCGENITYDDMNCVKTEVLP
ncbi:hypothetical protein OH784_26065 [Ectobacillus funiculus]